MKATMIAAAFLSLGFLFGCNQAPRLERPELNPPTDAALQGTYKIIEETVSGKSPAENTLETARLEILPDGVARFVDFPLFDQRRGVQGLPRKITCGGRWLVVQGKSGYLLTLDPDRDFRFQAVIVEGGDLLVYYAPSTEGYFTKWRKTP
ncbi:MAG: hypothetical protein QM715_07670 [Nibricoccus sp.]